MSKFTILNEKLVFDEGVDNYAVLRNEELKVMRTVLEKYKQMYDRHGKTKTVLERYTEDVQTILKDIILNLYNRLIKYEIYNLTQSAYSNNYGCGWDNVNDAYEELLDKYEELTMSEVERNASRTARRQNRGRIIGGGFGLEGAVKGMATAGALNMTAGALHGTVNLIGSGIDKINTSMQLSELYKDTKVKEMLAYAIVIEVEDIYEGFRRCINDNYRKDHFIDNFDEDKATALFDNARKIPDKRKELLVESLKNNPFVIGIYKYILNEYGDANNELQRMADQFVSDSFNILNKKLDLVEKKLVSFIYSEPKIIKENIELFIDYCSWLGVESSKYKVLIDEILSEYDLLNRKVDGVEYETKEEADYARNELEEFIRRTEGVTINKEEELYSIRRTLEQFQSRTKDKYIDFIEKELKEFDHRYRTVQKVIYESREEADNARNSIGQIEHWYQEAIFNNADDIQGLRNKIEKNVQSDVKELYIDKLENMYQVWERAQHLCTVFPHMSLIGEDRINTSKILYQALESDEELKAYELNFPQFQEELQNALLQFMTINNVRCESILKANMEYAKEVKHAISYFDYLEEKNSDKKSLFKKALNGVKGLIAKNYEVEYNYITNNGTMGIPIISDWKLLLESMEADNKYKITQLQEAVKERYIRLTLPSEVLEKIIYSDSIIIKNKELSRDRINAMIRSVFHGKGNGKPQAQPTVFEIEFDVTDVFYITGRGCVISGILVKGDIEKGDIVDIYQKQPDSECISLLYEHLEIGEISKDKNLLERATENDMVGLLFKLKSRIECKDSKILMNKKKNKKDKFGFDLKYDVILLEPGSSKVEVIKVIREMTEIELKEAKDLSDSAPCKIVSGITESKAHDIQKTLEQAGAVVELVESTN